MFRKKHYIALGAVLLAAVLILSLPTRATSRLKLAFSSLFLPLFGLSNGARELPPALANSVLPRRELLHEIDRLEQTNQELKVLQLQANAVAKENEQLRAALAWQRQQPWKLKLANVIARDPANWWRTIQIDAGFLDGVRANLPVLTTDGLVGRTIAVEPHRSQVILIGDPNCRVSALVDDPARDIGILSASGPLDNSFAQLTYLSGNATLKAGQKVFTSGEGGVFPKGIPVGQIVDAQQVDFGLYTEARVKLSADFGSLERVWVLLP
ncbi:MAG TPA: rod shape-determining protein MreC [Verrucomicrobiae bacterium]|nr:rod shape-determining protein MreC [Verrucomicrobiae bacterium]